MKTMVTKTTMTTQNHGAQEPIGISRSIISMAISKENSRKNTHTPEAYDDFKHGISKAKENKNNLQSYDWYELMIVTENVTEQLNPWRLFKWKEIVGYMRADHIKGQTPLRGVLRSSMNHYSDSP